MPPLSCPSVPPKSIPTLSEVTRFRRRLLAWFRRHGRDLPWRRTRDPYQVLVSEIMLQQTQVARVEEFYPRFLARFPTLEALAAARPGRVRETWDGLGYYRRAANLQQLARTVVAGHRGEIPRDVDGLRGLPGVGRYTAGAVASFAYEQATPCVDTNVERVLRRVFHPRLGDRAGDHERLWETAARLLPRSGKSAWAFNQGIMERGALVCTCSLRTKMGRTSRHAVFSRRKFRSTSCRSL
jgi:A/G-specific adenine glycosylase